MPVTVCGEQSSFAYVPLIAPIKYLDTRQMIQPTGCTMPNDPLSKEHRQTLEVGSGISPTIIQARGYRTVEDKKDLAGLGFIPTQQRVPGLLIPLHAPDGSPAGFQFRSDNPRKDKQGKAVKYELPSGSTIRIDCPPQCRPRIADPSSPLFITEGAKKADALASRGLCAVNLTGVWAWKGRNEFGGVTLLADWDYIPVKSRAVYITFDSDSATNPNVQKAQERLAEHLRRKEATVMIVRLPQKGQAKVGVDDFLIDHSVDELLTFAEHFEAEGQPKPCAQKVELLENAPPAMTKPLQLIGGRGYAAVWPWVKVTTTETQDKRSGNVIRHDPPLVNFERRLFVVRDDGLIFGPDGNESLEAAGLVLRLDAIPRDSRLWSTRAVKDYASGKRPDPLNVFERLSSIVDRFMSFDRSLGSQRTICEMLGCYILATWFLDAFQVIGFLWPNGGYGSGKTKMGILICEASYLGESLLSGSTYATLRDLADYGATLLFDDAENVSDPKKFDPDKRNLLLAGNRRGSSVALKEMGADKAWHTRYVNTYCARLFTATHLPDPILSSRTIVIPLLRTTDTEKANADVLDYSLWPCDQRELLDDLWSLALAHLAQMPEHEVAVNRDAPLVGRNLEPWRAILAVAHWLDKLGASGIYDRTCELAKKYQTERIDLETPNLTLLVVKTLIEMHPIPPLTPLDPLEGKGGGLSKVTTEAVTQEVNKIAAEEDLTISDDPFKSFTSNRQVGRILSSLRLTKLPKEKGRGREWGFTLAQLDDLAISHGFDPVIKADGQAHPEDGGDGGIGGNGVPREECEDSEGVAAAANGRTPFDEGPGGVFVETV